MDIQHPRTVFYHAPCLDGAVAAWAVHKTYGDSVRYVGLDHADYRIIKDKILQNVTQDSIAIFVDFAPRRDILEEIIDQIRGIEVYDHHVTSEKDLVPYMAHPKCKILFDMHRSGAGMAFDVFSKTDQRPLFIDLVEKLDLYQPEKFESLDQFYVIAAFLGAIDVERPLDQIIPEIDKLCEISDISYFEQAGTAPRQKNLIEIENVLKKISFMDLSALESGRGLAEVPVVKADISALGHEFTPRLMAHCPHTGKVAITWSHHDADTVKLSFRSDPSVDVSLIAEELGREYGLNGGGHKGAAAVRFSAAQFEKFAKMTGLAQG